jgi:hypothetical protein
MNPFFLSNNNTRSLRSPTTDATRDINKLLTAHVDRLFIALLPASNPGNPGSLCLSSFQGPRALPDALRRRRPIAGTLLSHSILCFDH